LKQAPRAWFSCLTDKLRAIGFRASKADPSLFIWHKNDVLVVILIYVDDIIITNNSGTAIHHVLQNLHSDFAIKELGDLSYFLGVEVLRSTNDMYLTQRKYVAELLNRTHMAEAKPYTSPMSTTCHVSTTERVKFLDPSLYRQVVGSLQHLTFTRPDFSFSIHKVSKFMHNPLESHCQAVKRILRYLKHTISTRLFLRRSPNSAIQAFSDSDWAGDRDDRWSISAYCVFMGNNLILWRCKQQFTVARSSIEAEYKSLADTASELQWLQSILSEIGLTIPTPQCYGMIILEPHT
jgi:histone deacetylase 1/2